VGMEQFIYLLFIILLMFAKILSWKYIVFLLCSSIIFPYTSFCCGEMVVFFALPHLFFFRFAGRERRR
jgi:hypothetical protein